MRNVLSVDVEDYFQVEAFASVVSYEHWDTYELRVERNVFRILDLFARHGAIGTFFVLGWIAEKCPSVVREIAAAGHEIASHGYAHQRLLELTPKAFRADLKRSVSVLTDLTQEQLRCYRAPSFSVVSKTLWALDILADEGFDVDSSIFPVRHDLYGMPEADRFPHWVTTSPGHRIFEFPPSTLRVRRNNLGVAGGGYLRVTPYRWTVRALRHINEVEGKPGMIYFHPWEIDPEQPRIRSRLRSKLRHYTNLSGMYAKLDTLLRDFKVASLSDVCHELPAYRKLPTEADDPLCVSRAATP